MILHLVNDEKIIPRAIDMFEKNLPGQNYFLCFQDFSGSLIHLKNLSGENFSVYKSDKDYSDFAKQFDSVIVHFLNTKKINFCNTYIPAGTKITWIAWGGDLYGFLYRRGFRLFTTDNSFFRKKWFLSVYDYLTHSFNRKDRLFRSFIKNSVTNICILQNEYNLLKKYFHHPDKRIIDDFFYYPIETVLGHLKDSQVDKETKIVLCGNCASITNNHETSFRYLRDVIDDDTKVIVPLSYGGTKWYKDKIAKSGRQKLGNAFCPLYDFMPLEEYNKVLLSGSVCIYSNRRQEAMGNILISLYLGAKVYMFKSNPLYEYFNSLGVKVYPLNNITKENFWNDIDDSTTQKNRELLLRLFNEEALKKSLLDNFSTK